ncbi:MAG: hypothetical protein ACI9MR_004293 [Myxococcota bacterium]
MYYPDPVIQTHDKEAPVADDPKTNAPKKVQIKVNLTDEQALGSYVNMARIFHNQTEFVLDALFLPPPTQTAHVVSRLLLSPIHAKFLFQALGKNIQLYEQKFGEIKVSQGPGNAGPILH